jgi:hypothetical protein
MKKRFTTHHPFRIALFSLMLAISTGAKAQDIISESANTMLAANHELSAQPENRTVASDESPLGNAGKTAGDIILPIYVSNFNAIHDHDCSATLRWKTNTELGISEFYLEHSTDGISFNVIHSFLSDSKAEGHYYAYSYPYASNGANFFRIRTRDIMSDSNYGPIVRVLVSCFEPAIQAYPNPARNLINLRGVTTGQSLQLSNMFGKVMRNQVITTSEPSVDLDGLQPGIYVLVVNNEHGQEISRTRINKQ